MPNRSTILELLADVTIIIPAHGSRQTPALRGEYPSVNCRYSVSRNVAPNIAKKMSVMPELAAVKRGFLKKAVSSIGWSMNDSHHANAPITATATPNATRMRGDVHPESGASMIP